MKLSEVVNQTILYACNDWGMGHVARSIPIIQQLQQQNNRVIFAGTIQQQAILREYFSELQCIDLKGYEFQFSGKGNWSLELLKNSVRFVKTIQYEQKKVQAYCAQNSISLIISDHRYGFRHPTIPSIFITHQVTLPLTGIQQMANYWHTNQLKKFNSIWVLDNEAHTYAGKLSSTKIDLPIHYIGIQSRFSQRELETQHYILAVISGPEPYSEQLFHQIVQKAHSIDEKIICICPKKYAFQSLPSNLELVNNTSWKENDALFYHCKSIISRSGYTTIMDNVLLQKPIHYIPTPGQMEQEYLAKLHTSLNLTSTT